jgi:hypothetical protein
MKGDFSTWNKDRAQNFRGTLHQQGRVLLDRDWNAQTEIFNEWQETAGRDAFGAGVAAVPAEVPLSFKVTEARLDAGVVKISANKGRVWADGLLVEATKDISRRVATYLNLPAGSVPDPASAPSDAVILETWLEALSPFQATSLLIEPALGGVDTTERVQTAYRFRLFRMADGENCQSIASKLEDDFAAKGKLTVKLNPTVSVAGDCPVVESGGYTGFEHRLYRIEIAETRKPGSWFKWSQFNGGLVGTGDFDSVSRKVTIHGNLNAIVNSGLNEFYLEALDLDESFGYWRVIYGAKATRGADNALTLPPAADPQEYLGSLPPAPASGKRFFRLWNGIEAITNYIAADKDLPDLVGIKLRFETDAADKHTPSDFWTFEVRAGEIGNAAVLIGDPVTFAGYPPQGVFYHRVPLAELDWTANTVAGDGIRDCRIVFQPLTKLKTCCTYRVGDAIHSHGDFTRIQDAINALPGEGGEVCVLPGLYNESLHIFERVNVMVHGCGPNTRVSAKRGDFVNAPLPGFLIEDSSGITIRNMAIEAGPRSAVQIGNSRFVTLRCCLVQMRDVSSLWQAIFSRGDDVVIEYNTIEIVAAEGAAPVETIPPKAGDALAPSGVHTPPDAPRLASSARGGIQVAGGSDRVRIFYNRIRGGTWNGITLGSLEDTDVDDGGTPDLPETGDHCEKCRPIDLTARAGAATAGGISGISHTGPSAAAGRFASAGDLYDIEIGGNHISDMGINGIGVVRFFDLLRGGDMVGVHGLYITDNIITRCVRLELGDVDKSMERLIGYGGIALAKVSDLRILRNQIMGNGASARFPICGVFALMVQGLQLDENRIFDNGHALDDDEVIKPGVRGGVHVWLVLPTIDQSPGGKYQTSYVTRKSARNGLTTCDVRDNVIVAPLGRALTFFALGPVVVARNRLVTKGSTGKGLDLAAATVLIGDLGISNEWTLGLLLMMFLTKFGNHQPTANYDSCGTAKVVGMIGGLSPPTLAPPLSSLWATGKVLLTENQITLDVVDAPFGFLLTSVFVLSLDDVGMTDNQCEISSTNVFVAADAFVVGGSVRVADNRFSETWMRTFYSALTFAGMNTTTDNQSTHCILARALLPRMLLYKDNLALIEVFCPGECSQG